MLLFLDCEFTDFIDCELISLGMVSAEGQHEIYLEVTDFDRLKCNAFVQSAVWSQLGKIDGVRVSKNEIEDRLRQWLSSLPGEVVIASDSQHDRDLLTDALDGILPEHFCGWLDLRESAETPVFKTAVMQYHSPATPWHHALHDARAIRAGWLAWNMQQANDHVDSRQSPDK